MKKVLIIAGLILTTSCLFASQAFSETASDGATLTITGSGSGGDLTFEPSSKMNMSIATDDNSYSMAAGHNSVIGKDEGKAYGLSSSSTQMFWLDYDSASTVTDVDATGLGEFTSWDTF